MHPAETAAATDTPLEHRYEKLLSFVVSNAWQGENMAVLNYSDMVPMFSGVDEKIDAVHQARDEGKHVLVLENLARKGGFRIDPGLINEEWLDIRGAFLEAVKKGDLAACLIIQDLMVEALAVGLYRVFSGSANQEPEAARAASKLLDDELRHLDIGIRRIQELMQSDSETVHDSLVWAHSRVMPRLFDMVHNACDFLCSKNVYCESSLAYVEGGELHMDGSPKGDDFIDLEALKVASLEHYVGMLDRTGFDPRVVNQLIASMSAYEVPGRVDLGIDHVLAPKRESGSGEKCC